MELQVHLILKALTCIGHSTVVVLNHRTINIFEPSRRVHHARSFICLLVQLLGVVPLGALYVAGVLALKTLDAQFKL